MNVPERMELCMLTQMDAYTLIYIRIKSVRKNGSECLKCKHSTKLKIHNHLKLWIPFIGQFVEKLLHCR